MIIMTSSRYSYPEKKMLSRALYRYLTAMVCCVGLLGASASHAEQVVVYSARIEQLIKPMFDAFTKDTGIAVKFVTDKEGPLLARLKAEGKNTPADMLITSDAGNLWEAAREGLLRPVESKTLETNIPAYLRDPAESVVWPVGTCPHHHIQHTKSKTFRSFDLRSTG